MVTTCMDRLHVETRFGVALRDDEPDPQIVIELESSHTGDKAPARAQLSIDDARRVRDALTQQIENAEQS